MVRYCPNCGKEGSFFEIRTRNLPISSSKVLCNNCYQNIFNKEYETLKIIHIRKEKILRRMYEDVVKRLCREARIPVSENRTTTAVSRRGTRYSRYVTYYFTYDELINKLIRQVPLEQIIDFSKRNNIPINDILSEFEREKEKKVVEKIKENGFVDELYQSICDSIYSFEPLMKYDFELPYHIDIARFLKNKFPNTKIEVQRSSARPDIVIDGIAIEIKGPTTEKELDSIPSKCLRYPQQFIRGMIIVLFDLQITNRYFEDWRNGIKNKFPNTTIIAK
jgi:hypothetical protein